MPNECWNKLELYGPRADVLRFKRTVDDRSFKRGKATKNRNVLDLARLAPVPTIVSERGPEARQNWQIQRWSTKWNTWDSTLETVRRLPAGISGLRYSFMTAWAEPTAAIVSASKTYPSVSFVLAGIDVDNPEFVSRLIRRGHIRAWRMPEKEWLRHAEMETDDDGEYLASYQPEIMDTLLDHWRNHAISILK